MNRPLLLCLISLLALVAGCAPSLESKLIGRWRLDTDSIDIQKAVEQQIQKHKPDMLVVPEKYNSAIMNKLQANEHIKHLYLVVYS